MGISHGYVRRQTDEITQDRALCAYGAALALVNALTCIYWLRVPRLDQLLSPDIAPVCWPFFPSCDAVRVLPGGAIFGIVFGLLVFSLLNAAAFFNRPRGGWWLLLILSAIKYGIIAQDFRLTLNHHYMALWVTLSFLFVSNKRRVIPILIVTMYFFAGLLKINPSSQWLTGAAFYGRLPLGLPSSLIAYECAYVIALELLVAFGLLVKRPWVFWGALGQFVLFHVASFWVVGFFYPMLMFLLLSIFVFDRLIAVRSHRQPVVGWHLLVVPGLFTMAQLVPFAIPGDSSITGEGRMFALNMFDAPLECHATLASGENGKFLVRPLRPPFVNTRTMCDPVIFLGLTKAYCRAAEGAGDVPEVSLRLESRKVGEVAFHSVVSIDDFCRVMPTYSLLGHNWWININ